MKPVFDITIDFEKSHGSFVYDKKLNTEYLDLFSMYSSLPLGYNHAIFDDEYKKKISNISHLRTCNNLFKSDVFRFLELGAFKPIDFIVSFRLCARSNFGSS